MEYPYLIGKCRKCLGCNRLEDINFKGVYRCENYVEGVKDEFKHRCEEKND